jgi:hypothetical protein
MKSFLRWGATLSLVGATLLTSWLGNTLKALGLPTEQILKTLGPIPVFTIADDQGAPLIAVDEKNKNAKVTGVFVSKQDAQKFLEQLQKGNPDVAKKVKVQPVSLADVFKLVQANEKKPDGLNFAYVPSQTQVEAAKKLLSESGQQYQGGVPLFVARAGKDQGYLTVQQNNQTVIPMFFEKGRLEEMVARFKKDKPELASTVKIEVISLEGVIATLEQSNDASLGKILLIPSDETMQFIRDNQPNQPKK